MKHFWYVCGIFILASCLTERPGSKKFATTAISASSSSALHYATSVYQVVEKHCSSCHGASQPPLFGVSNIDDAHETALKRKLINVDKIEESRFYTRLSVDSHNCWSTCEDDAEVMLEALKKWLPFVNRDLLIPEGTKTLEVSLSDGTSIDPPPDPDDNSDEPDGINGPTVVNGAYRITIDLSESVDGRGPASGNVSISMDVVDLNNPDIGYDYYRVQNVVLKTASDDIAIKSISILLNGNETVATSFKFISDVVSPPEKNLSRYVDLTTEENMGVIGEFPKDKGLDEDKIQLVIQTLKVY
ncbi:MAG: hypothetical protein H6621_08600 [Halobacteriovoraceae bacterium]|nr:hypothetical protein [Halobacteriovoraceae bacterium]MCB9095112.1 hypothetical protein [Halobacteriovoraceae bacterium]